MTMSHETSGQERGAATALVEAAATAGYAPSLHNTQPWRWRVLPRQLELHAVRERQLPATDPQAQLLTLSCGTALHHATTALTAEGWNATVERFPDPADENLLARITIGERITVDPEAMRTVQCMRMRHTDRRPVSEEPVAQEDLYAIGRSADAQGARLQLLDTDQMMTLAAAAAQAAEVEANDPEFQAELAYWTSRGAPGGTGLPVEVLPASHPQTTVPGRDFGRAGTLPIGPGHDRAATFALLNGDEDEPVSWLRAGEALSAAWLTATRLGVSVVPLSGVIEVAGTRQALRVMLAGLGYPYLVLRLGIADPEHAGPPHTPRLPTGQVVDTTALR